MTFWIVLTLGVGTYLFLWIMRPRPMKPRPKIPTQWGTRRIGPVPEGFTRTGLWSSHNILADEDYSGERLDDANPWRFPD